MQEFMHFKLTFWECTNKIEQQLLYLLTLLASLVILLSRHPARQQYISFQKSLPAVILAYPYSSNLLVGALFVE